MVKAHGLGGEVVVDLVTERLERVAPGSVLRTPKADLTVVMTHPFQARHLVRFDGIETREAADALRGQVLRAEPLDDPEVLWVHDLIGSVLEDRRGASFGRVTAVESNPASDLLVLEGGGLVPLCFVVETTPGRIVADLPEGLFD